MKRYFSARLWAGSCWMSLLLACGLGGRVQGQNTQLAITQAAVVGAKTMSSSFTAAMYAGADALGNTYLAGTYSGTLTFGTITLSATAGYDVFVTKRNAAGVYEWALTGGGAGQQFCQALAVSPSGEVHIAGRFTGATSTFGSTTVQNAGGTGARSNDIFVAKVDGGGNWQWAASAGGETNINGDDSATAVAVDALGQVYVAGTYDSSVAFFWPAVQIGSLRP